ncbi:uncharacterized protein I303_101191 [Kwoniella dejecticola CBS 10117]|uniref:Pentatricopeptide repeat domain-containing protein n=1 Tax=Kwoniella dejecticola CBS 10117 TaxID=1296121 RepID=A0A1A6AH02_9TREE|nr:uncharacterized protein I303_01197 [Kwoniella dejecticola CBS 10117]OBR89370.1 hypothetical protein I303_01197 [Kwoniella dejecticola CBS 10117]
MLTARKTLQLLQLRRSGWSSLHHQIYREYHGDPGPSTQKSLRTALTSIPGKGRHLPKKLLNADLQLLDQLISPASSPVWTPNRPRPKRQVSLPLRLPTSVPDRRAKPNAGPSRRDSRARARETRERDDPYTTSTKLKRFIERHTKNKNMTEAQIEEAVSIVMNAPKDLVNAPVWNILLGFMGKQRKLNRMWTLYNDMKKRGIKPTTRTFSTLLNAYSRTSHSGDTAFNSSIMPVKDLTHSRVTILHDQAQQHIKRCMTASSLLTEDLGISTETGESLRDPSITSTEYEDEIDIAPTNAYLKYLGRHGLWEDMYTAFISMPQQGRLSPDKVTYTTLFASLHNIHVARSRAQSHSWAASYNNAEGATVKRIDIGSVARGIWDQCSRQFSKSDPKDRDRQLDNDLVSHVLRCLIKGRPEDSRQAIRLTDEIWSLPPPNGQSTSSASSSSPQSPKLQPDVQSATSLIQGLLYTKQTVPAAHYATLFLANPQIEAEADIHFLKICISALSDTGDIGRITNILQSYQPPSTGMTGWQLNTWKDALQGARWSGDFPTALTLCKRATQISDDVENHSPLDSGRAVGDYEWTTPNGRAKDIRGVNWIKPKAIDPDFGLLAILLRSAISTNNEAIKKVLNIIGHFGGSKTFAVRSGSGSGSKSNNKSDKHKEQKKVALIDLSPPELDLESESPKALGSLMDYAKSILSAIERLNPGQRGAYEHLRRDTQKVVDDWSGEIGRIRRNAGLSKEVNDSKQIEEESDSNTSEVKDSWQDEEALVTATRTRQKERRGRDDVAQGRDSDQMRDRRSHRRDGSEGKEYERSGRRRDGVMLRGRSRHFEQGLETRHHEDTRHHEGRDFSRDRPRKERDFGGQDRHEKTSFGLNTRPTSRSTGATPRKMGFGLKKSSE